jgi:hypothetical protein
VPDDLPVETVLTDEPIRTADQLSQVRTSPSVAAA